MARIIDDNNIRLTGEISLVRVIETSGLSLIKRGPDHVGRCPFHDDDGASLLMSADSRWACPVCEVGGDVIDWVVKRNGISRHHAIALLKEGQITEAPAAEPVKTSTVPHLPSPVTSAATDQALLTQVVGTAILLALRYENNIMATTGANGTGLLPSQIDDKPGDVTRLLDEISLVRVVELSGLALTRQGKEHVACCPFHDDEGTSLLLTADNRWRCTGCGASGDVIDWVIQRKGVSRRHAIQLLKEGSPEAFAAPEVVRTSTVRHLSSPVNAQADDQALLAQVVGFYHDALKQNPEALAFLESKGLVHGELISRFRLGYANRTLGLRLPKKNRKAGEEIRSRLERIGLYRESGHEHLNGALVVPIFDRNGQVVQIYGRKIGDNLRPGTLLDLQMTAAPRGVWNLDGLAASRGEVILTSSLIDAMTFWCAGFRNVTAAFGANGADGFSDDHLEVFRQVGTQTTSAISSPPCRHAHPMQPERDEPVGGWGWGRIRR